MILLMLSTKKIFVSKFKTKEESKEKSELKEYINNTLTFIEEESKGISNDFIVKYFNFLKPIDLANKLYEKKDAKKTKKN